MAKSKSSFTGNIVHIYDMQGQLLLKTRIREHDSIRREIEIDNYPMLNKGESCRMVVTAASAPQEYMGTVVMKRAHSTTITLFQGKEKSDGRQSPRYPVNTTAVIESLVYSNCAYMLLHPLEVKVVDISKSGARICTESNAMLLGDKFEMRLLVGPIRDRLLAEVVNFHQASPTETEYGCSFYEKENGVMKRI